jgi:hypothetical protein
MMLILVFVFLSDFFCDKDALLPLACTNCAPYARSIFTSISRYIVTVKLLESPARNARITSRSALRLDVAG